MMVAEELLFQDVNGSWTSIDQLTEKLFLIGASECDVLVVQSGVMFGKPNRNLGREKFVANLFNILMSLNVKTMILPTFTFSFCNHENYDVMNSKSSMGALSEYARKQNQARRTMDPLLSMVEFGKTDVFLGDALAPNSLGEGSAYDLIHNTDQKVKFLCYGSEFSEYFTYVHYVEKALNVPYRFDMTFDGAIIDCNGKCYYRQQTIHTACSNVQPAPFPQLKEYLIERGQMKCVRAGNTDLVCVSEHDVYQAIEKMIQNDINYFLAAPFQTENLVYEYKYGKDGNRITHC